MFNPETDRVHHLNGTAVVLFELCDGSRDTADLSALVAELFSLDEPPSEVVDKGLHELMEQGVVVQAQAKNS